MRDAPVVSVITIFLDAGRFLSTAVESVLGQDFESWELILVDDGSTDGSSDLARDYEAAHPGRIRYIEHEQHANLGMSASRNLGVRESRGEFVAFIDADDEWFPTKLTGQVALARRFPDVGMILGATEYWWDEQPPREPNTIVTPGARPDAIHLPPALALGLYPLGSGAAPCPSDILVRRSTFDNVGGFEEQFRGDLQMYEDQAFLSKVYLASPVYLSSSAWSRYRRHADSFVSRVIASGGYAAVRRHFLDWYADYTRRHPGHPAVAAAIRRQLWELDHPTVTRLTLRARLLQKRIAAFGRRS